MKNKSKPKFSHPSHTGKKLAHKHTSYHGLIFLLILLGVILIFGNASIRALNVDVTAYLPNDPPSEAAIINNPVAGANLNQNPIIISGTCQHSSPSYHVKVFSNNVIVGTSLCVNGSFSIGASLLLGNNNLVAKTYNFIEQPGPDSVMVSVLLKALDITENVVSREPVNVTTFPDFKLTPNLETLRVVASPTFVSFIPGEQFNLTVATLGGKPPYAVNVEWGDDMEDIYSLTGLEQITISHTYDIQKNYQIMINATDSMGNKTQFIVTADAGGKINKNQSPIIGDTSGTGTPWYMNAQIVIILYASTTLAVIGFWMGEVTKARTLRVSRQHRAK